MNKHLKLKGFSYFQKMSSTRYILFIYSLTASVCTELQALKWVGVRGGGGRARVNVYVCVWERERKSNEVSESVCVSYRASRSDK